MEISKDAVIKAIGQPDPGDMDLINQLARREVQEDMEYIEDYLVIQKTRFGERFGCVTMMWIGTGNGSMMRPWKH